MKAKATTAAMITYFVTADLFGYSRLGKMTTESLNQPSALFPPELPYGSSPARRRGIGSVARRLGWESLVRRSMLPAGKPRP